ncbi:MAG TPA: hypothetical protein VGL81_15070 [Polyangiaceae bacterium]
MTSNTAPLVAAPAVAPPPGCGTDTLASNASGASVVLASDAYNGSAYVIEICATTDGVHWTGPTAVGDGQEPVAAVAPNGRAVLVWLDETSTGASSIQASILPPGGSWSSPATLSSAYGRPHIVMDGSGNAMAMWAPTGTSLEGPVQTDSLAASSTTWAAPITLVANGGLATLVGNAAGDVLVTWRGQTTNLIEAAGGTILGGFRATENLAQTNGYVERPSIPAINSAGDGIVVWISTFDGTGYTTMTPSGTWSAANEVATTEVAIGVAINSAGNFVVTWTASDGGMESVTVP